MFPLYDSTPQRHFPIVNYLLITVNVLIFLLQLGSSDPETFIMQYGFIPQYFNTADPSTYSPVFSSLFLHGGFFHILSNMMFLHIFGDNIEDVLGHMRYLAFYLIGGLIATLAQYFIEPSSAIPLIGASGAVSAVAGAYYVLFSGAKIKTLVPLFGFITLIDLSAGFVLGYWFITQIFSGLGSLTTMDVQHGGIAFFAHIGGFVYGYFIASPMRQRYA